MIKSLLFSMAMFASLTAGAVLLPNQTAAASVSLPQLQNVYAGAGLELSVDVPVSGATPRADGEEYTFDYHYWSSLSKANATSLSNMTTGDVVTQAIEMPYEDVLKYAGNRITSITVCSPYSTTVNPITDIRLVIIEDGKGQPVYTQDVTLTTRPFSLQKFTLETPFEIKEGVSLYVGWQFTYKSAYSDLRYIPYDQGGSPSQYGGSVAVTDAGEALTANSWLNLGQNGFGPMLLSFDVTGANNMIVNSVDLYGMLAPLSVAPGKPFDLTIGVASSCVNEVKDIEVSYTVNGVEATQTVTLDEPLTYNGTMLTELKDITVDVESLSIPFTARITKVNGVANTLSNPSTVSASCPSLNNGFERAVVVEEATGLWCGYCPMGYVMMENLRERYADKPLIPIAVHRALGTGSPDPMNCSSYANWVNTYISGFPSYTVNRDPAYQMGFIMDAEYNNRMIDEIYNEISAAPAIAKVDLEVAKTSVSRITATAKTRFAVDGSGDYRLAFVVKEDSIGPYNQTNYLNSSTPGFGEFSTGNAQVSTVSCMFNDVARIIDQCLGINKSIPATVEADVEYTYTRSVSITSVKNKEKFDVVALVLNYKTGCIENATVVHYDANAGIDKVDFAAGGSAVVEPVAGGVAINGDYARAEVYTTAGVLVATANGESFVSLPAGLYLVKADSTVTKVIVR